MALPYCCAWHVAQFYGAYREENSEARANTHVVCLPLLGWWRRTAKHAPSIKASWLPLPCIEGVHVCMCASEFESLNLLRGLSHKVGRNLGERKIIMLPCTYTPFVRTRLSHRSTRSDAAVEMRAKAAYVHSALLQSQAVKQLAQPMRAMSGELFTRSYHDIGRRFAETHVPKRYCENVCRSGPRNMRVDPAFGLRIQRRRPSPTPVRREVHKTIRHQLLSRSRA